MTNWTTREIQILKAMHVSRLPSGKEMMAALPRHSEDGVMRAAVRENLRPKQTDWKALAQRYFVERALARK